MKLFTKNRNGFTLIELLVVCAIIAVLAVVAVIGYSSVKAKSRDARRMSDINSINSAIQLYHENNNDYHLCPLVGFSDVCINEADYSKLVPAYLAVMPKDPKPLAGHTEFYQIVDQDNSDPGVYGYGIVAMFEIDGTKNCTTIFAGRCSCQVGVAPNSAWWVPAGGGPIMPACR